MKKIANILVVLLVIFIVSAQNTHAYLDPGAGSYITQIIISFLAAILASIKIFWAKISSLFKKTSEQNNSNAGDQQSNLNEPFENEGNDEGNI